jgi:uncharacterized protein YfeS
MTDRQLKMYAISGLIVRIDFEKERLKKATDETDKNQIKNAIETMQKDYTELLEELQNKNPLE